MTTTPESPVKRAVLTVVVEHPADSLDPLMKWLDESKAYMSMPRVIDYEVKTTEAPACFMLKGGTFDFPGAPRSYDEAREAGML